MPHRERSPTGSAHSKGGLTLGGGWRSLPLARPGTPGSRRKRQSRIAVSPDFRCLFQINPQATLASPGWVML